MDPVERLKQARIARGEALHTLSRRTGVAERMLRAIEDGRFEDLPAGIYGRAAIRSYASAFGIDPAEVFSVCDSRLPALDDPIAGIGRLNGVRQPRAPEPSPAPPPADASAVTKRRPDWRMFAAAVIDAAVVGGMLAVVIAMTSVMSRVPPTALESSAASFAVMGMLLAGSYFIWLGGLAGATVGERAVGLPSGSHQVTALNLRAIAVRTVRSGTDGPRFLRDLSVWLGQMTVRKTQAIEAGSASPVDGEPHLELALGRDRQVDAQPALEAPLASAAAFGRDAAVDPDDTVAFDPDDTVAFDPDATIAYHREALVGVGSRRLQFVSKPRRRYVDAQREHVGAGKMKAEG